MFTKIEAKNFKAFGGKGISLDLGRLTIFVGQNNSGKTSTLEAIALLAQSTVRRNTATFNWQGPLVDFGVDGSSAWFRSDTRLELLLGISCEAGEAFREWLARNSPDANRLPPEFGYRVAHRGSTQEWRHEFLFGEHVQARNEAKVVSGKDFRSRTNIVQLKLRDRPGIYQPHATYGTLFAPELFTGNPQESGIPLDEEANTVMSQCALLMQYLRDALSSRVFFVGADRGPKREKPEQTSQGELFVGRRGEHTFSVLSVLFARPQYVEQSERIRHWAEVFGMPKLRGGWAREEILRAGYVDSENLTPLNVESAGFGSQQILPVIVQLFCAPTHSLIMIEEPEISLHPEAQVQLVRMLSDAVAIGQQVIITTHSQTLLLALSEAARSISPADVSIYHLARGSEGAAAKKLSLDSNWSLPGWVPSFSKVEKELLKKWIVKVDDELAKEDR